jgi:hypothetical protein
VDISCGVREETVCENGCKLNLMVLGGGGVVGYYAAISMWRWYLHVYVVSYVSLGRYPYRLAFFEECTGVSLCTFVVFGG